MVKWKRPLLNIKGDRGPGGYRVRKTLRRCNECGYQTEMASQSHHKYVDGVKKYCGYMRVVNR